MFLVYIETLKLSIGAKRLEKLANAIIFRDDGGIFRRENCFCGKKMLFRILLMADGKQTEVCTLYFSANS